MNIGYGLNREKADLIAAGADPDHIWIDFDKKRLNRAEMLERTCIREGDTLILLSLNDLGGSPVANKQWKDRLGDMGVTIKVVENIKPKRPAHRPRKYEPNADDCAVWQNGLFSEAARLDAIEERNGARVSKGVLNRHYGSLTAPKPWPQEAAE